jgi:hypothetical protein
MTTHSTAVIDPPTDDHRSYRDGELTLGAARGHFTTIKGSLDELHAAVDALPPSPEKTRAQRSLVVHHNHVNRLGQDGDKHFQVGSAAPEGATALIATPLSSGGDKPTQQ